MEFNANAESSETQKSAFTDALKAIENDFYKFNELLNQNSKIEDEIEKQLEKEDRKCTFLKHTVDGLEKQLQDAERITNENRKYIFDQQMELEQISSSICEHMQQYGVGYPDNKIEYYTELVKVIQHMVQYVKSFDSILEHDVDECIHQNAEMDNWNINSQHLIDRISELKIMKSELLKQANELKNQNADEQFHNDFQRRISNLHQVRREFQNCKNQFAKIAQRKISLNANKLQVNSEMEILRKSSSLNIQNCETVNVACMNETNTLLVEITEIDNYRSKMIQEFEYILNSIEKELEKYHVYIAERTRELENSHLQKNALTTQNREITTKIDELNEELLKLEMSKNALKEQEQYAKNMLDTIQLHTNMIKKSVTDSEIQLKNLTDELVNLRHSCALSSDCVTNENIEHLLQNINMIKTNLQNMTHENGQLERKRKQLHLEVTDLRILEEELKCKINAYEAERDLLNGLSNQITLQLTEQREKSKKQADANIAKIIENVNEISNISIEKNLLLNSIKVDVDKCTSLIPTLECRISAKMKENVEKKAKLFELKECIIEEEKTLQNKLNLLQDLEKNSFPRNQIPSEWFQSFEKYRIEYEQLKNERMDLDEKRNKLLLASKTDKTSTKQKIDMKLSEIFEDGKADEHSSVLEKKQAAFEILKERIKKKN